MTFAGLFSILPATEVMDTVDRERPRPNPEIGEPVFDYWLRVVRYHAWEDGYGAAILDVERRSGPPGPNGPVDPSLNPHERA